VVFAWAGWANWEYRRQTAERLRALTPQAEMAVGTDGGKTDDGSLHYSFPLIGKPAPAFALEDLGGKKISLADYKGKALMINFWATWCGPCKIETPWLIALRSQYAAQGFEVLGISADELDRDEPERFADEKKEIEHFVRQTRIPYPVLIDGISVAHPYGGLDQLPTSFFIDSKGTVVGAEVGITSKEEIEANIRKALGK
jgi:cytochrome c biogenesis protein CcmG/thiol:disulfide interchange protein DsbE